VIEAAREPPTHISRWHIVAAFTHGFTGKELRSAKSFP